jgi:hypothetical protein
MGIWDNYQRATLGKTAAQAGSKVRSLHRNRRDTMRHIGKGKQTKCCSLFLS